MRNHVGREIEVGDFNINGELLTQCVRYEAKIIPVSDEWERKGIIYVSDAIGYPIKTSEIELVFDGILSGEEVLKLMQHLANKGNCFFCDTLIQFNLMDDKEKSNMIEWLSSLELGKDKDISAETELLLMQFE